MTLLEMSYNSLSVKAAVSSSDLKHLSWFSSNSDPPEGGLWEKSNSQVHPSNTPGSTLIPTQLIGSDNYGLWRGSICIALQAKRKLGFITGTCRKNQFSADLHEDWETCNAIVLSWIMNTVSKNPLSGIVYTSNAHLVWEDLKERFDRVNRVRIFQLHREIATISQGTDIVAAYFTKLKELWAEYDALVPSPGCDCAKSDYIEHLQ
ncbi:uncharacterized protein [Solanum tuberosum]|uniref:uncharacterized protein n=1 Tax=Solanum tuberosum TaxID=4113 RepID=UPI00073A4E9A|nr:PREDICTED: uncharacterized protein LOC107061860 [Solanum tuberosum]